VTIYQQAGDTGLVDLQTDVSRAASRRKYAEVTSAHDDSLLQKLAKAKEQLARKRDAAQTAKDVAQTRADALAQQQAEFESMQAAQQQLLAQVNGDIAHLVAEEQAKRAAAEAPKVIPAPPAADAPTPSGTAPAGDNGGSGSSTTPDPGASPAAPPAADPSPAPVPAPSGRGAAAVAYVVAQLGKPYCYAGVGPDCFDCSGLTMQAWAQAGVYMSHNSEAQLASFSRVSMSDLQPGDIVWSPGHVGIYVGSGAVIHAPHTGDVVRYIGVSYFQAAVRPG
jgi:cell wall-associated NlpC family hydrolase